MVIWTWVFLTLILGACAERGTDPASEERFPIALQVDVTDLDMVAFRRLEAELLARRIDATFFITSHFAKVNFFPVHTLYKRGFEIALLVQVAADQSYEQQLKIIGGALEVVLGCVKCGSAQPVVGFRPYGFTQNSQTYRVLDTLGLTYNAGFQSGLIYEDGRQGEVAPYALEGHDFVAVPVSTSPWQDRRICLSARCCVELGVSAGEWELLLLDSLEKGSEQGSVVVVVHTGIATADDDPYWLAFLHFLERAKERAVFLTTRELILQYGVH